MGIRRGLTGCGIFIAISLLASSGCAFLGGGGPAVHMPAGTPASAVVDAVPFYAQEKFQCGPAALAMVLQWSGVAATPESLAPALFTPGRQGTLQTGLITGARRHERLAFVVTGLDCLLREIAAGRPVVVLQNLGLSWLPHWHYAVVIGYDLNARQLILHSGETAGRRVGLRTFLYTWNRAAQWGLLVLPPGRMPLCAEPSDYLKAALGLQQAGYPAAAVQAFSAAVARWPDNAAAFMALGNALYAVGSLREATQAFAQAVQIDPGNGDALNNLAHLLAESQDLENAEITARRAVAVGGRHRDIYLQTLNEILLQKN
jgi:hypothetical protein